MMFVTSPRLSLMVVLAIPAAMLPLIAFGRWVRRLSRRAQDTLADASAYAAENLERGAHHAGVRATRRRRRGATGRRWSVAFDAAKERMQARAVLTALAMFLVVASITGVLWFGAASVIAGSMTGGRLGQFVLYAVFAAARLCAALRGVGRDEPGRRRSRAARRAPAGRARNPLAR